MLHTALMPKSDLGKDRGEGWRELIKELPKRTRMRTRGSCTFFTLRSWNVHSKSRHLGLLKTAKADVQKRFARAVALECAEFISGVAGPARNFIVTSVPCGHSRSHDCLAAMVSVETARIIGATHVKIWGTRVVPGSSFPRPASERPPLAWIVQPRQAVLLIDDVVTSGSHMEECLTALRNIGVPAFGVAWLGGEVADQASFQRSESVALLKAIAA